ncbi:MFS general substrate transporter [Penicillium concentricum]|uniref:MFS general substrate transporter n=1 Tax=Penicillium concentricum TaxID=293559 RepID=A0A9W9SBU8_9EURO|nr:MFS general substrate transporter [Penicillium concentricum]KAJ5374299.1 MFS general substrate transporter [Penicillium concentricum]
MSVRAGLLATFQVDTSLCFQIPNLAAQTLLPNPDVPSGLALMLFGQLIGAAIFVSIGENILGNQLVKRLSKLPGFNPNHITSGGVTELLNTIPDYLHNKVLHAYNEALRKVFEIGLVISCLIILGAATLEWKSIKKGQPKSDIENIELARGENTVEVAGVK